MKFFYLGNEVVQNFPTDKAQRCQSCMFYNAGCTAEGKVIESDLGEHDPEVLCGVVFVWNEVV